MEVLSCPISVATLDDGDDEDGNELTLAGES